jgi:hypothetical protein
MPLNAIQPMPDVSELLYPGCSGEELLEAKAELAQRVVQDRHLVSGLVIPIYTDVYVEEAHREVVLLNAVEQTARYLAALAFRAASAPSAETYANIEETFGAIELAHRLTGQPGVVARGYLPEADAGGLVFAARAQDLRRSHDHVWLSGATSHTYAMIFSACAILCDTGVIDSQLGARPCGLTRGRIRDLAAAVLDRLLACNLAVTDADGNPLKPYVFTPGHISVRWRFLALQALQLFLVGHHLTAMPSYIDEYRTLAVEHGYAKLGFQLGADVGGILKDGWGPREDLAAYEAYYHLLAYERDPGLVSIYRRNLAGLQAKLRRQEHPYLGLIREAVMPGHGPACGLMETLIRMPVVKEFCHGGTCDGTGPHRLSAVPIDERPPVLFEWACSPRRTYHARSYLAPVDYLLTYWMARHHGAVARPQAAVTQV